MKRTFRLLSLSAVILFLTSFTLSDARFNHKNKINGFSEGNCTTSFGGNVSVNKLYDNGREIGHSIWINRSSRRVSAKYFADNPNANSPLNRYNAWRRDKSVVLVSSGAYATSFHGGIPVGITVDNGKIINQTYESKMDGLVIIYATGGIVVSDIEEGNLSLEGVGVVDIKDSYDRQKFFRWAQKENATVFQTHLLAYKNQSKIYTRKSGTAVRKFLILAKDRGGSLYHIIFYTKKRDMTLAAGTKNTLKYLKGKRMNVIAMVNLDTGGFDVLGTGGDAKDCNGNYLEGGTRDRSQMTNMLAYHYK